MLGPSKHPKGPLHFRLPPTCILPPYKHGSTLQRTRTHLQQSHPHPPHRAAVGLERLLGRPLPQLVQQHYGHLDLLESVGGPRGHTLQLLADERERLGEGDLGEILEEREEVL